MVVMQSSQWLPVSVVPGTIGPVPPVIVSGVQGPKVGVGVGEGVGVGLAVGVGVGDGAGTFPGAWITAGMGAPVLKKPTVEFVGFGAWSASNRKLYNVP